MNFGRILYLREYAVGPDWGSSEIRVHIFLPGGYIQELETHGILVTPLPLRTIGAIRRLWRDMREYRKTKNRTSRLQSSAGDLDVPYSSTLTIG